LRKFWVIAIVVLIGIQFITVEKTNPPVTGEIYAPPIVMKILKKSCYNCHSNETVWPFYAYIAPISWFVVDDVSDGRAKLNFTEWDKISHNNRIKIKKKILKEISEGEMPISGYKFIHPNSEVTYDEQKIIKKWITGK